MTEEKHHIVGYKLFTKIWVVLLILTAVTVLVAQVDLGYFNVIVALTVASTKALFVILYFMHLKYEPGVFKIMVIICFVTLAIFIGLTFFDVAYR